MAHGDYSCCAICDRQLHFGEARTKEDICIECLTKLRDRGVNVLTPEEFRKEAERHDADWLALELVSIGYCRCYYNNSFDDWVTRRLRERTEHGQNNNHGI